MSMQALPDGSAPIADAVLDEAIRWFVLRASGDMSAARHVELERWLAARPEHTQAWERLNQMGQHLQQGRQIAPELARGTLRRVGQRSRRKVLGQLLFVGAAGSLLWLARDELRDLTHAGELRTATGQRRTVTLADGTRLHLNTATAVAVHVDASSRRITLRRGEIEVSTAPDASGRSLWVETPHGRLTPVGTRFTVHLTDTHTRLAVTEGAVDVRSLNAPEAARIAAGKQTDFDHRHVAPPEALDEARTAWASGMLVAADRSLADLLDELARHRPGYLHWSPGVAQLRVTGTWPLTTDSPTDAVLASLERRLPIRIQYVTRYWVKVSAR